MGLTLAPSDVRQLQVSLRLLLSPAEFKDSVEWRTSVCRHLLDWVHADAVYLTFSRSSRPSMIGMGRWGRDVLEEYTSRWQGQEVDQRLDVRGITSWVREMVMSRGEFRRTAYCREFCDPIGFRDSGGALYRFADGEKAILYFCSSRNQRYRPGDRSHRLLDLLQPAVAAGAMAFRARQEAGNVSIDYEQRALALISPDGRLLHASSRMTQLVGRRDIGSHLRRAISRVANDAARVLRSSLDARAMRLHASVWTPEGPYHVHVTLLTSTGSTATSACLVAITEPPSVASPGAVLSAREQEVATLLSDGLRNRDIASALGVSEHTARRHTERVLRKLGLHSRAGVARALDAAMSNDVIASSASVLDKGRQ